MVKTNQLTDEIEDLWMRIAAIDGWVNIEKKEADGFTMLWGASSIRNTHRSFFSIPDYPCDLNAITTLFKERNIYYNLEWISGIKGDYAKASCRGNYFQVCADTEALALCKLLLAINPAPIAPSQVAIIDDDGEVERLRLTPDDFAKEIMSQIGIESDYRIELASDCKAFDITVPIPSRGFSAGMRFYDEDLDKSLEAVREDIKARLILHGLIESPVVEAEFV
jgi:hypothetical protein